MRACHVSEPLPASGVLPTALRLFLVAALCLVGVTAANAADKSDQPWQSVVRAVRDPDTGASSIKVNGYLLQKAGEPRTFHFLSLWQYDVTAGRWRRIIIVRAGEPITLEPEAGTIYSARQDRELVVMPDQSGLFWCEWEEDGRQTGTLVHSGPILCNDLHIGPPPEGMIAACVPSSSGARAMFVPDPQSHCREPARSSQAVILEVAP